MLYLEGRFKLYIKVFYQKVAMPKGGFREGGGRPKGSVNKVRRDALDIIQKHKITKHYDPLLAMAILACGHNELMHKLLSDALEILKNKKDKDSKALIKIFKNFLRLPIVGDDVIFNAHKELAQYVYPKQRSIEIKDPNGDNPLAVLAEALIKRKEEGPKF